MTQVRLSLRGLIVVAAAALSLNCGGGSDGGGGSATTPTSPTVTTPTRVIAVSGNLSFGQVTVGSSQTATMTISNSGNSVITVSSIFATSSFVPHSTVSWSSGTIAAGGSQNVTVTFRPTVAGSFSGTLTVNGDQTSGTNSIAFSASSVEAAVFPGNWSGTYQVERCDGAGSMQDILCSAPSGSRPGGVFPIGTQLPITLSLSQSGSSVNGTIALGEVRGTVSGTVVNGVLTLSGTARNGTLAAVISQWSTSVSGSSMTGTASYNITISGAPGTGVMVTRLSDVRR
jgi:hypothetical protein